MITHKPKAGTVRNYEVRTIEGEVLGVKVTVKTDGWQVDTADLTQLVPFAAVGFATPTNVTAEAYRLYSALA